MSRISDKVRAVDDLKSEIVPITDWGVEVEVRGMTLEDRTQFIRRIIEARENEDDAALAQLDAEIVVASVFDPEDGSKAFTEDDIPWLMTKSGAVLGSLAIKANRFSGLDQGAEERLGKGFSTSAPTAVPGQVSTPSVDSSSVSPENSD